MTAMAVVGFIVFALFPVGMAYAAASDLLTMTIDNRLILGLLAAFFVAALATIRRALVEGQPVTRSHLAHEASVALGEPPGEALKEVDAEAQRLGVSSLL